MVRGSPIESIFILFAYALSFGRVGECGDSKKTERYSIKNIKGVGCYILYML